MLTRCPHCQTAFRVTSEQLKARLGRVRCGECREVFDALDSLADEKLQLIPAEPAPADMMPLVADEPEPETEPVPTDMMPLVADEPEPETEPVPTDMVPLVADEPEPETEPAPEPEPETESEEEAEALPAAWDGAAADAPPRRWPWVLGSLLLLLSAAGQLLFVFRVELAVLAPELRPALVAGCDLVGCAVPHPRKAELASIETSDLTPAGEGRLLLTALLKNRAPFVQEYPHLELTLTDTRDEALLRKVLAPADWLPAGQAAASGFAARSEIGVRLLLDAPGVPAIGYRLYLFYP